MYISFIYINTYQNMDSPPRPVPMGSPVCIIKSLCHKGEYIRYCFHVCHFKPTKTQGIENTHLYIINKTIVVVLDFAELQEIQTSCKKSFQHLQKEAPQTVRADVRDT